MEHRINLGDRDENESKGYFIPRLAKSQKVSRTLLPSMRPTTVPLENNRQKGDIFYTQTSRRGNRMLPN